MRDLHQKRANNDQSLTMITVGRMERTSGAVSTSSRTS
jgi:hypothetical protein